MPPRMRICPRCLGFSRPALRLSPYACKYAATASAITPAPSIEQITTSIPPIARYPPTQPPSHRPPEYRKSQLHRQYTSLLRSSPLMLLFQHNNLKATEFMAVRRELLLALRKVDAARESAGKGDFDLADVIKVQVIQTNVFAAALRVVEYFRPELQPQANTPHPTDPVTQSSKVLPNTLPTPDEPSLTHGLSRAAWRAVLDKRTKHTLTPLLSGPLMVVSFPTVSTEHLKAVISILAPNPPNFPAPKRSVNPGYHEPITQNGLQKLLLLGARVEGRVFDNEGTRWVGGIEGGLDGLRGQLVATLQGVGASVTGTLESAARNLYFTVESRRSMLEEEKKSVEGENSNG